MENTGILNAVNEAVAEVAENTEVTKILTDTQCGLALGGAFFAGTIVGGLVVKLISKRKATKESNEKKVFNWPFGKKEAETVVEEVAEKIEEIKEDLAEKVEG